MIVRSRVELLLLLYAMLAGLTGVSAGTGPLAQAQEMVCGAGPAAASAAAPMRAAARVAQALGAKRQAVMPVPPLADARRAVDAVASLPLPFARRAAPERRRE